MSLSDGVVGGMVGASLANKGPNKNSQINKEIAVRDYGELTKRELAHTMALWAWDKGLEEGREEKVFTKFFLIILFLCLGVIPACVIIV